MARGQAESGVRKDDRQPAILNDRGGVLGIRATTFELTICREPA